MCAFFNLPDPANSHFTGLGDNTTRTDYRVVDPVRVVHCKSAERQPAIPNSHRDSRSLRRTLVAGSKLPRARFEAPQPSKATFHDPGQTRDLERSLSSLDDS